MKIRFLDENLPPRIEDALRDLDAQIDVIRVGDPGTPTLGTLDPDILTYLESSQRVLVTGNRRSIPKHLAAHMAAGRHHFGITCAQGHPLFRSGGRDLPGLGRRRSRRVGRPHGLAAVLRRFMQTDSRIEPVAVPNADSNAIESGAGSAALDASRQATQAVRCASASR